MKDRIFWAIIGALFMLIALMIAVAVNGYKTQPEKYEHIDYVSAITPEECYVCGNIREFEGFFYWGQDNVGIVNLNTFDFLPVEINRYDHQGKLLEEPAGYMSSSIMSVEEEGTYVHAHCFPDSRYASLQLFGVKYAIDRDSVQNRLCQTCLDSINELWFVGEPPAEYAVLSFQDRTIRPLLQVYPWFPSGNFGIDCEFKEDGKIDLLIHDITSRYT